MLLRSVLERNLPLREGQERLTSSDRERLFRGAYRNTVKIEVAAFTSDEAPDSYVPQSFATAGAGLGHGPYDEGTEILQAQMYGRGYRAVGRLRKDGELAQTVSLFKVTLDPEEQQGMLKANKPAILARANTIEDVSRQIKAYAATILAAASLALGFAAYEGVSTPDSTATQQVQPAHIAR